MAEDIQALLNGLGRNGGIIIDFNRLIKKLKQTSSHLSNNGRNIEANELEDIIKQLQDSNISRTEIEELKQKIISRCDNRWLGDIHIKEIENPYEWWNILGSIKSLAEKL